MRKQTYKTQIGLIFTVTVIGLLLPGLAEAGVLRAKEVKGGLSTRAIQRGEGVREDSSKQNLPAEQKDPPTRTVGTGTLSPAIIASRTSGTAPFAVFFEGTNSRDRNGNYIGDSTTTADPQSVGLLGNDILEYTWDFGEGTENDPGGRYFSGFNAAHVYETPGPYTVTLTIRDELGSESITMPITVNAFSGETYCFARTGGPASDFDDCPNTDPNYHKREDSYNSIISNYLSSDRRLLLKRRQTFSYSGSVSLGSNSNIIIGAYPLQGSLDSRPLIQGSGTAFTGGNDNIMITDLKVSSGYVTNLNSGASNLLVLRTQLSQCGGDCISRSGDLIFIIDSSLIDADGSNMYHNGDRLALINNEFANVLREHNLYGDKINRAVITRNYWHDSGRHGLRIAANSAPGSWNVVVSENKFERNGLSSINLKETSGHGYGYGGHNILIERNDVDGTLDNQDDGYTDIIFRNNIINSMSFFVAGNAHIPVSGVRIYGNTILNGINVNQPGQQGVEIKNNILISGSITGAPGGVIQSNNFFGDPGFVDLANRNFHLQSGSPAIDAGASLPLVYEDYDKNRRPIDGDTSGTAEWDIGAYEYGLLTLLGDFDQDGDVDMDDYAIFEAAYAGSGRPPANDDYRPDLDGDGDVDLDDFSIVAANYTG